MIDLKATPEAVLTLATGDTVQLGEVTLVVTVWGDNRMYFTNVDCRGLKENIGSNVTPEEYDEYYQHLRRIDPQNNKAVMVREEVLELLQSGGYYVG